MKKTPTKPRPKSKAKAKKSTNSIAGFIAARRPVNGGLAALIVIVVAISGYAILRFSQASSCTVSATLVNSCRPWLGAAVGGDPHAPSSDKWQQFLYLEKITGRQLDIFHDYHPPGNDPLNADEISAIKRSNTYAYINWKPASNWGSADGSNATVNANIKKAADNIKTVAPHKLFLTVWHEPQNDVSGGTTCPLSGKGSAGTPAQYRAMWQNVRNIFNNEGVNNVVWVINYQGYPAYDCMIPELYPGNGLVDWVAFETYAAGSKTMADRLDHAYSVLTADTDATHNFTSKPWAVGEFNDCGDTASNTASNFQGYKTVFDQNKYPRVKMAMVFESADGPGGTSGCLLDNSSAELSAWKALANDPVFNGSATTTTPTPTPNPTKTPTPTPTPTPTKTPTPTPTPTKTPTPTPTPVPTPSPTPVVVPGTATLVPSSDTYVTVNDPNTNYGSATPLVATLNQYRALMRLKTAGVVPAGQHATSAKLKLYTTNDAVATGGFQVHNEDPNWTASTVTWNTQPTWDNNVVATSPTPHSGQWVTISLPLSAVNLSGDTTFGISYSDANSGAAFASREDVNHQPQLEVDYTADSATGPIVSGIASKCLDDYFGSYTNGNKIELWTCNGITAGQSWTVSATPGSPIKKGNGYCLDVKGGGTTSGTNAVLWQCNGSASQQWTVNQSNDTIVNTQSGLCLDDEHSGTADGNQVWIYTCNGTNAQRWTTAL